MAIGDDADFDRRVEDAISGLPVHLQRLIESELPVIVLDRPTPMMCRDLGIDPDEGDEMLGLHTGVMETERSVEQTELPTVIHLFRIGLREHCRDEAGRIDPAMLDEEIRTTMLHELGHHFGLEEDDLDQLGYG
ncbi:MAG: metallopeptidase family protein [Planctomycetota bacterium]